MSTTIHAVLHLILFLHTTSLAVSYSFFRDRIPNGHNVPNPCGQNIIWRGVGHENPNGGGDRNPFGVDFQQLGMKWGHCLCELDSDGDGRSNGEELGDPNCEFVEGGTPTRTTGITHPGVCEPLDGNICRGKNSFLNCQQEDIFSCPQFVNASVKSVNLTLPRTPVPAVETTYICKFFDLPTDGDYSMIGFTPVIANADVVHHILLYGCTDDVVPAVRLNYTSPNSKQCAMITAICNKIIGAWAVGSDGECLGDQYGFRIGSRGIQGVVMEVHWSNPLLNNDYTDASGLQIYYTPNKRPNDAGTFFIGPQVLIIPPRQNGVGQYGGCPAECTSRMLQNSTIYIPAIIPHMHYLGRGLTVSIKKNGSDAFQVVLDVQNFNYNSPKTITFDPPLQLSPGDEVNVTCTFVSVNRTTYTWWGLQTSDEMCFAITTYYPYKPTVSTFCTSSGSIALCAPFAFHLEMYGECFDQSRFWNDSNAFIGAEIYQKCDVINGLNCTAACKSLVDRLKATYPECLKDDVRSAILSAAFTQTTDRIAKGFVLGLLSCEPMPGLGVMNTGGSNGITLCQPIASTGVLSTPSLQLHGLFVVVVVFMALIYNR